MRFKQTVCFGLTLGFALLAVMWPGNRNGTVLSASPPAPGVTAESAASLYRSLGVVKLAGIAPPVDIVLDDPNGRTRRLSDFKGKIVLLNFWTTWCPDCREEMPSLEKLHQRFKDREFAILAINLRESNKRVNAFFEKYKLSFTSLLDKKGDIGVRFGIRSIPTTFILNSKGGLIGKVLGPRKWDSESAVSLIEHLVSKSKAPN